jgi:hypothetical protein
LAAVNRKMKAWLVTWEWVGDHAKRDEKIAAIFNPRFSAQHVRELVEFIYLSSEYSLSERMDCARNRSHNRYPARFGQTPEGVPWWGEIDCGHNPFLWARMVDDFMVETDEDGKEKPSWKEAPRKRPLKERLDEISASLRSESLWSISGESE